MTVLRRAGLATLVLATAATTAAAQNVGNATLLPGASSHDPVHVESSKLDYFDKEQKLVYSGGVVARQGETTMKASTITIFLSKEAKGGAAGGSGSPLDAGNSGSSVRRMEVSGPVTVISKDEVGTGDNGAYDKAANKITLTGNVTLTQGTNIIKGDQLTYDMTSGHANVSSAPGKRIISVFTPGSGQGLPGTATKGSKSGHPTRSPRSNPAAQAEQ